MSIPAALPNNEMKLTRAALLTDGAALAAYLGVMHLQGQ
jgi:hypothetical protein